MSVLQSNPEVSPSSFLSLNLLISVTSPSSLAGLKHSHTLSISLLGVLHGSGLPVFNGLAKQTFLGNNFTVKHLGDGHHLELTVLSGDIYAIFCRLVRTSVPTGH